MTKSGDPILDAAVDSWLRWTVRGSRDWTLVHDMVTRAQYQELRKVMQKRLTFGTAGIRGVMGPGYAKMNDLVIIQTSQGLAQYVLKASGEDLQGE